MSRLFRPFQNVHTLRNKLSFFFRIQKETSSIDSFIPYYGVHDHGFDGFVSDTALCPLFPYNSELKNTTCRWVTLYSHEPSHSVSRLFIRKLYHATFFFIFKSAMTFNIPCQRNVQITVRTLSILFDREEFSSFLTFFVTVRYDMPLLNSSKHIRKFIRSMYR